MTEARSRRPFAAGAGRAGGLAAAVAAGALLLSGCGSSRAGSSSDYTAVPGVRGVRTGDGGKALVVAYTAGPCRQAAKARVAETASAVTLTAALPKSCRTGHVEWALKIPPALRAGRPGGPQRDRGAGPARLRRFGAHRPAPPARRVPPAER